ncbi:MAG: KamA family radical SAM protein [Candidatus Omnitrophica bacterium]|nr:KamA family radical SAM protein [Candidatus Omnitrophota bacterium]
MDTLIEEILVKEDEPPGRLSEWNNWNWQLKNSVSEVSRLKEIFSFSDSELEGLEKITLKYPFAVTPYYLSLISVNLPDDPIKKQCIPSIQENDDFQTQDDPLGEEEDSVVPGLIHRYPDRALITLTDMCPVYCRHCTRKREWKKGKWVRTENELKNIYDYLKDHKQIRDVIVSGGDPLLLSTHKIEGVLKNLRTIPHLEIIRIGTRCPVVLPQRIDDELVAVLKKYRPLWLNTHFNHSNEITEESARACDKILCAGIPINNQSVLLKGVNDSVEAMKRLCEKLLTIGVRPYYLFQCDPVNGTGYLRTSIQKGLEIIKQMRGSTSGLAIPTFVIDGLSGQGKIPLQPNYLIDLNEDHALLKGCRGGIFKYHNPGEK